MPFLTFSAGNNIDVVARFEEKQKREEERAASLYAVYSYLSKQRCNGAACRLRELLSISFAIHGGFSPPLPRLAFVGRWVSLSIINHIFPPSFTLRGHDYEAYFLSRTVPRARHPPEFLTAARRRWAENGRQGKSAEMSDIRDCIRNLVAGREAYRLLLSHDRSDRASDWATDQPTVVDLCNPVTPLQDQFFQLWL